MRLRSRAAGIVLGIGFLGLLPLQQPVATQSGSGTTDPHAYFNTLIARPDHWKSYSFRDARMFRNASYLTYDPSNDTNSHRQDAAKVVIPAFVKATTLAAPLSTTETTVTVPRARPGVFQRDKVLQIDGEIVTVLRRTSPTTTEVMRGTHGTKPASHEAGADVRYATNSLPSVGSPGTELEFAL